MREKRTLFDYVYQHLREQITSGRLKYGDKLPSLNNLSGFYHVGIRTVKDVLRALKREGYIYTEERKTATVIYRQTERDADLLSVLSHRTAILEAYQTIAMIMPAIFAFCSRFYSDAELSRLARNLALLSKKPPERQERDCAACLYDLLRRSGNLLFRDLYVSLEIRARAPYFRRQKGFAALVLDHTRRHSLLWAADALPTRDESVILSRFQRALRSESDAAALYLEKLAMEYGRPIEDDLPLGEPADYLWIPDLGRDYYYNQIVRDLIDKIAVGYYPVGSYLPSEARLAQEYNVCVSTVRKSLTLLNELGYGKTLNVKGTQVLLQDDQAAARCMKNKTHRLDTLLYLSGLQLFTLTIGPAALEAFGWLNGKARRELAEEIQQPEVIPLDRVTRRVIECQRLEPPRTILMETSRLLNWGYYFSFFPDGPAGAHWLREKSLSAIACLDRGDAWGFADGLRQCYCHILSFARERMLEFGLWEAEKLISP